MWLYVYYPLPLVLLYLAVLFCSWFFRPGPLALTGFILLSSLIAFCGSIDLLSAIVATAALLLCLALIVIGYGRRSGRLFMGEYTPAEEQARKESEARARDYFGMP
ncbi:hypothetical protein X769_18315 [Mesorhizobium sp. LSJC268A00]|uniref:hypothetical protein n=1 Tax=unclassified Mesorhizobium TaxID=325217 RepID=UPI0003CE3404|nr:hypothetical protein [Mesorhizobium sp. LSJC268A00]ESX03417.1 hypothetical protein X769_18315 [Mesorhizobium sp. LSJC268A00]